MGRTNAEILATFKKANKAARERMAKNAGYKSADAYRAHLEGKKTSEEPKQSSSKASKKPVIHIVNILDASDSMSGAKFNNALTGINGEFKELKKDTEVDYFGTFYTFSHSASIREIFFKKSVKDIQSVNLRPSGMTALYDAIGTVLTRVKGATKKGEKVLINIFTDGQENNSRTWNARLAQSLIEECQALGFTVTFVGTASDVSQMKVALSIADSNTLVHNNTGAGVEQAFKTRSAATKAYSAKVVKGEDVLTGFYKSTNETL